MDNTVAAQYHTVSSRLDVYRYYLFDVRFLVSTNQISKSTKKPLEEINFIVFKKIIMQL